MPKKKKYPRLPNGMGEIRYLGSGRRNPYAVHPPSRERDENGRYIRKPALCYVPDWYTGFGVLSAYRSGEYVPGLELKISQEVQDSTINLDAFCKRILRTGNFKADSSPTVDEVYALFKEWKLGEHAAKKPSEQTSYSYQQGYNYLTPIKDRPINSVTVDELQHIVNACDKKASTKKNIIKCMKGIFRYAASREMVDRNVAEYIIMPDSEEEEHGIPFAEDELLKLWANKEDPTCEFILIMCYSGYRIEAYRTMDVNLDEKSMTGGVKNKSSKNRTNPIHSCIYPMVERRMREYGSLLPVTTGYFRNKMMYPKMEELGISFHTPHDCRHTFSALCEKYEVNERDRKRMLGHSFGADITNAVYGHRTLEELRNEIEKIKVPSENAPQQEIDMI